VSAASAKRNEREKVENEKGLKYQVFNGQKKRCNFKLRRHSEHYKTSGVDLLGRVGCIEEGHGSEQKRHKRSSIDVSII